MTYQIIGTNERYRKHAKVMAHERDIDIPFLKLHYEDAHKELRHKTWLQIMSLLETADIIDLPKDIYYNE